MAAAAAAGGGCSNASASRKRRHTPPASPRASYSNPRGGYGYGYGYGGAAAAEETEDNIGGRMELESDADDLDREEEEDSHSDGEQLESDDGEYDSYEEEQFTDVDGEEFTAEEEEEAEDVEEEEISVVGAGVAAAAAEENQTRGGGTVVKDVVVAGSDVLDCRVCFLPLKPPIFQCVQGHVVCSACCDKLKATGKGKCHVCGVTTPSYTRCHAMEHLVDSILVPCPHAAHGCGAKPAYHDRDTHARVCPHAPCRCPSTSCTFVGSTTALFSHFATVHGWPCTVKVRSGETFSIELYNGFNFFEADPADDDQVAVGETPPLLFLLNVMQERLGRAISVLCIHPHATASSSTTENGGGHDDHRPAGSSLTAQFELSFSHYDDSTSGALCRKYYQRSEFQVACTDLSNGLPNPDACFQFVVPNSVLGNGKVDCVQIEVKARAVIN